jgi:hypothetical protein
MSYQKLIAALPLAALFAAITMHTPPASAQEGMVVVRDPQTGQMRAPTPAEMKTLTRQSVQPSAALVVPAQPMLINRADNVRQVRLGEKSQVFTVASRGADGKLVNQCVQGASAVQSALSQPAATNEEHHHEAH